MRSDLYTYRDENGLKPAFIFDGLCARNVGSGARSAKDSKYNKTNKSRIGGGLD